ncbi:hypothetical protein C8Q75DRAFT_732572 [Abortiporus biennis]|nr:hypothetical protein C8Q75DRAFT_732572 [Abortiporus biennis]
MLFSKVFFPVLAVFGFASSVFAAPAPVAAPEPAAVVVRNEIEARQLPDLAGILSTLESTIGPILSQIESTVLNNGAASEISDLLGELTSAISDATSSIGALGPASIALASAGAVIAVVINIILTIVVTLSGLPILNLVLNAQLDSFVSNLLTSLEKVVPGASTAVGSGLPVSSLGLLSVLQLLNSVNLLGLGSLLSGILGLLGGIL